MAVYDILTFLLFAAMSLLVVWAIYLVIKKPKEILFGYLFMMKPFPGHIWNSLHLLFFPIWGPVSYLDKKYNWGIYGCSRRNRQQRRRRKREKDCNEATKVLKKE